MAMEQFDIWWDKNGEHYYTFEGLETQAAEDAWKVALEWVLEKGQDCYYLNEPWNDIKKELGNGD